MTQLKILITGGTGQVGFELQRSLMLQGQILAPDRQQLDLSSAQAVQTYLQAEKPSLVINAAAYTAVDKAESEQAIAKRLNAELPEQLADWCTENHAPLVHYSSDYVYPGTGSEPWQEHSPTGPVNYYGQTKLEGDRAIQQSGCNHWIFRTSWVYSARGNNFFKTMLKLGKEKTALNVVADQIGAPTSARLIAEVTSQALLKGIEPGVYHLAPNGSTSWQAFAQTIFSLAQAQGITLAITPEQVSGIETIDYPTPAQRPLNSRLDLTKLENALGCPLPNWKQLLELTLKEYTS